jgi:hypothetical protein
MKFSVTISWLRICDCNYFSIVLPTGIYKILAAGMCQAHDFKKSCDTTSPLVIFLDEN